MNTFRKGWILVPCLIAMAGCNARPVSTGHAGSILLVSDKSDQPHLLALLDTTLGRTIQTPQDEPHFQIECIDASELAKQRRNHIILIAARLESDGPTSLLAGEMLSLDLKMMIEKGDRTLFTRKDVWAAPQLILVIYGVDSTDLQTNAARAMQVIEGLASEFETKRLAAMLLQTQSNKAVNRVIQVRVGLTLDAPADYFIEQASDSPAFVRIGRKKPVRRIFLFRQPMETSEILTTERIWEWRREFSRNFLEPEIIFGAMSAETVTFAGFPAFKLRGLWQSKEASEGGPFFLYAFRAESEKMCYIVDAAVYAPGEPKMPHLWELEAVAAGLTLNDSIP